MKKNLGVIAAIIFFALFALYAGFETLKVVAGPSLTVTSPKDLATIRDSVLTIKGTVARAAFISINGRQIFADKNGYFEDELLLQAGYTIIRVSVKDRFDKEVTKDLHLTYVPGATSTKPVKMEEPEEEATTTATTTDLSL